MIPARGAGREPPIRWMRRKDRYCWRPRSGKGSHIRVWRSSWPIVEKKKLAVHSRLKGRGEEGKKGSFISKRLCRLF